MTIRVAAEVVLIVGMGWFLALPDWHAGLSPAASDVLIGGDVDWCSKETNCEQACSRVPNTDSCIGCASDMNYVACFQLGSGTTCTENYDGSNPLYCGSHLSGDWNMGMQKCLPEPCTTDPQVRCNIKPNTVSGQPCFPG